MRQAVAEVVSTAAVGPYRQVRLATPGLSPALEPGRAILARLPDSYLRRTWWPSHIEPDGFSILIHPAGGQPPRAGDSLDILAPVGRGFRIDGSARNLLLVAGPGAGDPAIGPLLPLIERELGARRAVTVALGRGLEYPVSELAPEVEVIHPDDAALLDCLSDALLWADQILVCGAAAFAAALAERVARIRFPAPRGLVQALHLTTLPCGTGACGACRIGSRLACVDGPVLELTAGYGRAPRSAS